MAFLEEWATESLEEMTSTHKASGTKVFVNGAWVGIHHDPDELVSTLRDLRRAVEISAEVSVVRDIQNKVRPSRNMFTRDHDFLVASIASSGTTPVLGRRSVLSTHLHCRGSAASYPEISHSTTKGQGRR